MHIATPNWKTNAGLAAICAVLVSIFVACGGTGGSNNHGGRSPLTGGEFLYVGDTVGNIHGFSIDPNSGVPTPLSKSQLLITNLSAASDVHLAADSSGRVLYATSVGQGGPNLVALNVDPASGALTIGPSQSVTTTTPGRIAVDPAGKNAYVLPDLNANTPEVLAFSIATTTHALAPLLSIALPGAGHNLTVDPSGAFVYVTLAGKEIAGFARDANTGSLTVLPGSPFAVIGDGPEDVKVTPDGKFLLAANLNSHNVSVLSLASGTGVLKDVSGSPFAAGNGPDGVAIDPSGKFVFVADAFDGTVAAFTLSASGVLTPAGAPLALGTNSQPGSMAVDPSGKFLYLSIVPRSIAAFRIDPSTGALTPVPGSPFPVGQVLRDVVAVKP